LIRIIFIIPVRLSTHQRLNVDGGNLSV